MRSLFISLMLLVSLIGAQAQSTGEIWYRPANVGNAEFKDAVVDGQTIRFFKGEWLETEAKGKGNIVVRTFSGDVAATLQTDSQSIGDHKLRTNETSYAPLTLKLSARVDTVVVACADTVTCMVISQTRNKILEAKATIPGEIVLPGLDSAEVLRFAPEKHASVIVPVAKIKGYGVPLPKVDSDSDSDPNPNPSNLYLYIGLGVAALLLIGGVVWFVLARKRKSGEKQQSEGAVEEKLARYERELVEKDNTVSLLTSAKTTLETTLEMTKKDLADAQAKLNTIREEVKQEYQKEIEDLKTDIETLKSNHDEVKQELGTTKGELTTTKDKLSDTETKLEKSQAEVASLNQSLVKFNTILAEVPFAMEYASLVDKLLDLSDKINASAIKMLELDVEDPYNLMKYISRYAKTLSALDMRTLNAELKMLEKGNMVLVGSTLATYNKANSEEDLKASTCQYFFTSYLQKLIDGLVVLNESMAGADRLVEGVTPDDVKVFADYREQLQSLCSKLGIIVENVRLFDKIGEKIDLNAQLVDVGFSTGDILDMENAVVYLEGSHRPEVKVRVKVQE